MIKVLISNLYLHFRFEKRDTAAAACADVTPGRFTGPRYKKTRVYLLPQEKPKARAHGRVLLLHGYSRRIEHFVRVERRGSVGGGAERVERKTLANFPTCP